MRRVAHPSHPTDATPTRPPNLGGVLPALLPISSFLCSDDSLTAVPPADHVPEPSPPHPPDPMSATRPLHPSRPRHIPPDPIRSLQIPQDPTDPARSLQTPPQTAPDPPDLGRSHLCGLVIARILCVRPHGVLEDTAQGSCLFWVEHLPDLSCELRLPNKGVPNKERQKRIPDKEVPTKGVPNKGRSQIRECQIRECQIRECQIRECQLRECQLRECQIREEAK